jgi:cell division septal protein FtsQ
VTAPQIPDIAPPPQSPAAPRKWKLIALILILVLLAPASWLARRAASRMEFFQLRSVAVEGTRYLSPDVVVERLAVDTSRSVWDDTEPLAEKLRSMPQVSEVEIRRRLPGTLVVRIRENLPVALAPSPRGFEAVDSVGVVLPIDLVRNDVDLPIANQRDRAILSLLTETRSRNPMLYYRISEITRDGRDGFILTLGPSGGVRRAVSFSDSAGADFVMRPATLKVRASLGVSVTRLTDIFPVESDLMRRRANVAELDLRYRDQVIARLQ